MHVPIESTVGINRVPRALVGHILSHGVGLHRIGQLPSTLTDYLLDDERAFPEGLWAYCWIYPYKAQVVAHGTGSIFDYRASGEPFVCSLIKFYPIGFMVSTTGLPEREAQAVTRLDPLATRRIDDLAKIILNVSFSRREDGRKCPASTGRSSTTIWELSPDREEADVSLQQGGGGENLSRSSRGGRKHIPLTAVPKPWHWAVEAARFIG